MSFIAIIGSAVASTLLSKVFSSVIQNKDQPSSDKSMFDIIIGQFTPTDKTDGVSKKDASSSSESSKLVKPESTTGATALVAQFNQPRINSSSVESPGFSRKDLGYMIGHIGESDFQRSNLLQSMVERFAVIDTDGNGKISASEAMNYESMGVASVSAGNNSPVNNEAGARLNEKLSHKDLPATSLAVEAVPASVASILQRAAQLRASYEVDAAKNATSKSISKHV